MCSNCQGDYENPNATSTVPLCECGHDVDLHDDKGCQVGMGKRTQCRCRVPGHKLRELPGFVEWYQILRRHDWAIFEAIRWSLWLKKWI